MGYSEIAGAAATVLFAVSHLPMLHKAWRTRDVSSYSLGNLVMVNVGNAVYTLYVVTLPAGPVWVLHSLYLVSAAVMLALRLAQDARRRAGGSRGARDGASGTDGEAGPRAAIAQ